MSQHSHPPLPSQPLLSACFRDPQDLPERQLFACLFTAASYLFYRYIKRIFCFRRSQAQLRIQKGLELPPIPAELLSDEEDPAELSALESETEQE